MLTPPPLNNMFFLKPTNWKQTKCGLSFHQYLMHIVQICLFFLLFCPSNFGRKGREQLCWKACTNNSTRKTWNSLDTCLLLKRKLQARAMACLAHFARQSVARYAASPWIPILPRQPLALHIKEMVSCSQLVQRWPLLGKMKSWPPQRHPW